MSERSVPVRAHWKRALLPLLLLGATIVWAATGGLEARNQGEPDVTRWSGRTMGTTYQVLLTQVRLAPDRVEGLRAAVQRELDGVEERMSTYRADSEVSRFNRGSEGRWFAVSRLTLEVLGAAEQIAEQSGGAFDVTVRPLVAAWGFGAGARLTPPSTEELAAVRRRVGHRHLELDQSASAIRKRDAGVEIDLSAIAKGYAVDRVVERLEREGVRHAMVEVGGEVRAVGEKAPGEPFRVGIESPEAGRGGIERVVELSNRAMATSGDYRNFYEKDGVRRSHTIDPRTGKPVEHGLASVTVLHESGMMADGYATAINVLGPEAGMELARELGLEVYLIVRDAKGNLAARATPGFSLGTAALGVGPAAPGRQAP